jgi:glycine cleavage system H lipoate-binding protein
METILSVLAFLAGLLGRFGLVLAIPVVLAVVLAAVWGAVRLVQALRSRAAGIERVGGLLFKRDLYYTPGHTWLGEGGGGLRVGLDDLAQRLLPEPRAIELPATGRELRKGEVAAVVTCGSKKVEITAPVDGTVVAINEALVHDPALIRDAYARGWLFAVKPVDAQYAKLPHGEPARSWMSGEAARLTQFIERELGVAAADGGEFYMPASGVAAAKWDALLGEFLRK